MDKSCTIICAEIFIQSILRVDTLTYLSSQKRSRGKLCQKKVQQVNIVAPVVGSEEKVLSTLFFFRGYGEFLFPKKFPHKKSQSLYGKFSHQKSETSFDRMLSSYSSGNGVAYLFSKFYQKGTLGCCHAVVGGAGGNGIHKGTVGNGYL